MSPTFFFVFSGVFVLFVKILRYSTTQQLKYVFKTKPDKNKENNNLPITRHETVPEIQ